MHASIIRAVVFDFDGLLADSEPLQIAAWETFLARYGRTLSDALLHEMFGLRVKDSSKLIQERLNLSRTPEQIMDERDEVFLELVRTSMPLMSGAIDLVHRLQREPDLKVALATSGHRRYIDAALQVTGLDGAFDVVVTGDDVDRGKPDPEIYLLAAEQLEVPASECIALEDAPHGIRSAKAAGMICLAVPNPLTAGIPGFDEADAVLSSLEEVVPWMYAQRLIRLKDD